jgi:biopolymer transport protein ExbB
MNMNRIWLLIAVGLTLFSGTLRAQETSAAPTVPAATTNGTTETFSEAVEESELIPDLPKKPLSDVIKDGGWMMYVLGVMSLVTMAFVLYFILVLRQRNFTPNALVRDVKGLVSEGRISDAIEVCRRNRSPIAAISYAALNYVDKVDDPDPAMLSEIMEGEGARQANAVQTQTQYLLDIAVVAPMCGLLGTVFGMLETFNVVAMDIAKAQPIELAGGVSKALVTTAAGLLVGIPAMIAYSYFRGRTSTLLSNMEIIATDLLTLLVQRKNK